MKKICALLIISYLYFFLNADANPEKNLVSHSKSLKKQEKKLTQKVNTQDKKQVKQEKKLERLQEEDKKQAKQEKLEKNIQEKKEKKEQLQEDISQVKTARWILPDSRLRLDQISFLGAHNALLSKEDNWTYSQQKWGLTRLLNEGVRALEIDLGTEDGKLKICHGKCDKGYHSWIKSGDFLNGRFKTFKNKMRKLTEWLKAHPQEIVFLMIDNMRDKKIKQNQIQKELDEINNETGIVSLILKPTDWDPDQYEGNWPTIRWMNDNKKQIVIFNPKKIDDSYDSPDYTFYQWKYVGCTLPGEIAPKKSAALRRQSLEAFQDLQSPEIEEKLRKNEPVTNIEQEAEKRKKLQRFFQLNHFTPISEIWMDNFEKIARGFGNTIIGKEAPVSRSDNKLSTIKTVVKECKEKKIMGGKNPNFLMLDFTNKFIADRGFILINEWNKEAAQNLNR